MKSYSKLLQSIGVSAFLFGMTAVMATTQAASTAFTVKGVWNTSFGAYTTTYSDGSVYSKFKGDFNGDGIGDILFADLANPNSSTDLSLKWTWLRGTGYSLAAGGTWSMDPTLLGFFDYFVADIDGDNKDDILYSSLNDSYQYVWYWVRSTGSTFESSRSLTTYGGGEDIPYVIDINGDNKDDLVITTINDDPNKLTRSWHLLLNNGQNNYTVKGKIVDRFAERDDRAFVGDYTGDGKQDLLIESARMHADGTLKWFLLKSTGTTFQSGGEVMAAFGHASDSIYIGDFNIDGKDDIAIATTRTNGSNSFVLDWYVATSNGNNFTASAQPWLNDFGQKGDVVLVGNFFHATRSDLALGELRSNNNTTLRWWMVTPN